MHAILKHKNETISNSTKQNTDYEFPNLKLSLQK